MKKTIELLKTLLEKKQQRKVIPIVLLMVVCAGMETLAVTLITPVIQLIMSPDNIEPDSLLMRVGKWLNYTDFAELTVFLLVCLIVIYIAKDALLILQYYIVAKFSFDNLFRTQQKLVHIFLHKPYSYYLSINTADIVRLISMDTVGAFAVLQYIMELCSECIVSVALVVTVFAIDAQMAVCLSVILVLLMLAILKIIKPKLKAYGASHIKYDTASTKWLLQFVAGIKDIKIAQTESFFEEQYSYNDRIDKKMEKERSVYRNIPRVLIETVCIVGILLVFLVRFLAGNNTEGLVASLAAFAVAAMRLLPSANRISSYLNEISYNTPALVRTVEHLQKNSPEETCRVESESDSELYFKEQIELSHISFKYENTDNYVLDDANMCIRIGQSVGIVGTSGAGKTTAVDVLLGLLKPDSGQVLVDGADIVGFYQQWLKSLSYIPQSIYLLDDTIRANILFGLDGSGANDEAVWEALEEAQIADFVRSLPEGLDTQIGERGVRLSGGQRQRIGIARALYTNPQILIFDEATSALDNETEEALMEAINSLHGKKTMIIIAHRLQTIQNCDVVYRVADGKVLKDEK